MFYVEGNPTASVVITEGRKRREKLMRVANAEAALAWCKINLAAFVYLPTANHQLN